MNNYRLLADNTLQLYFRSSFGKLHKTNSQQTISNSRTAHVEIRGTHLRKTTSHGKIEPLMEKQLRNIIVMSARFFEI